MTLRNQRYFAGAPCGRAADLLGIVAVQINQIEQIEPNRHLTEQIRRRMRDLHPLLKLRKTGDAVLEGDDFAVRDEQIGVLSPESRRDLWISVVQQHPVP